MKLVFFWVLPLTLAGCLSTKYKVNPAKIHSNQKFRESVSIEKLKVDSFDSEGFPAKFEVDTTFTATERRNLTEDELVAFLREPDKKHYLRLRSIRDSIRNSGSNSRLPAGFYGFPPDNLHAPPEWKAAVEQMAVILYTKIRYRYRRTIHFNRTNRYYTWKTGRENENEVSVQSIRLLPEQWYRTSNSCHFGLLSSGDCTLYFQFNKNGKVKIKKQDYVNGGPF